MQPEYITFAYQLTALKPVDIEIKLNNEVLSSHHLEFGVHKIEQKFLTEPNKDYSLSLTTVGLVNGPSIVIENMLVTWHDDDRVNPVWRLTADNEVWDYIDPDATRRAQAFEKGPGIRTVSLDYQVDGRLNGYINNYGHFKHITGEIDSLVDNGNKPYVIKRPGQFLFNFRAPIAYWLFRRLFVRIKPKDDYHTTS